MPVARIRPTSWTPDLGPIGHGGLWKVYGAVPVAGRWAASPYKEITSHTDNPAITDVLGFYIHGEMTGATLQDLYLFSGTTAELYRSNAANGTTLTSATGGAAPYAATSDAFGWQFTSFGNNVLATNGVDDIQIATTPTTNFAKNNQIAAPVSYDPKCKLLTTIKNHILIGNVSFAAAPSAAIPTSALTGTSYPEMVMWSATNNARRFGDPKATPDVALTGSDWQPLPDEYGAVTGLIGGDYALIFKPRAIYRMDGPPFTFRPIVVGAGTVFPNSIIRYYDDVYYWGASGPMRIAGGESVPEQIGLGRVQRTVLDGAFNGAFASTAVNDTLMSDTNRYIDISACADYKAGLIAFFSSTITPISGGQLYRSLGNVLVYSVQDDSFGFFQTGTPSFFARSVPFFNRSPLFSSALSGYILDGTYFVSSSGVLSTTGAAAKVCGFICQPPTNNPAAIQEAQYQRPRFVFPYISFPLGEGGEFEKVRASRVVRIRPVFDAEYLSTPVPLDITVTVRSKSRFPGAYHETTASYTVGDSWQEDHGWIELKESTFATHHQVDITFIQNEESAEPYLLDTAFVRSFMEIEIEYVLGGTKGSAYLP